MKIGEQIIIGRMGQQPMSISDANVDTQHAILRKTDEALYQIEDKDSTKVSERTHKKQNPVMWGKFNDDMHIMNWNPKK